MTMQVNVAEAKAHLSQLIDAAAAGEDVVIARAGKPLVRLVPVAEPPPRRLGFLEPLNFPAHAFDALTEEELKHWE